MSDNNEKGLIAKLFISGKIEAKTGLHIGGSKTALDIGGIDLNVIKTSKGIPFIPGSSLKGKMRSLLEIAYGFKDLCKDPNHESGIAIIFGMSETKKDNKTIEGVRTHLIVRDAFLDEEDFRKKFALEELEYKYTEGKWENTIERTTSKARDPRQIERVPAGAVFDYEMIYSIFEDDDIERFNTVIQGMRLLEDDYLGGSGSRGYGRVKFNSVRLEFKTHNEYSSDNRRKELIEYSAIDFEPEDIIKTIKERIKQT